MCMNIVFQVELKRSQEELSKREEDLEVSERVLAEKEEELNMYRQELQATEAQNRVLKCSMDLLKEDSLLTRYLRLFCTVCKNRNMERCLTQDI